MIKRSVDLKTSHRFGCTSFQRRVIVTAVVISLFAIQFWRARQSHPLVENLPTHVVRDAAEVHPIPALPNSPYLNTRSDVQFVGSSKCRSCHPHEYDTYRQTGMGRSLDEVDPDSEPPDVSFDHGPSRRRYRVYRQAGRMWHQEQLAAVPGSAGVVTANHPVSYVIGSGRHSRSYLLEIDGFMVESPITWYTSRKAWGMSPGYDLPRHQGFSRAVDQGCLFCHSGRSQAVDGSFHRIRIHETWIGCERCHGPGSLHMDRWGDHDRTAFAARNSNSEADYTIVNPAHLNRSLAESICSQCHLRASAGVTVRGRSVSDFRPGLPLDFFRSDFRLDLEPSQMTVVGHVEQLRLSACYRQSALTCTTCHNPHEFPSKANRVDYYRRQCRSCHGDDNCSVQPSELRRTSPDNNCIKCHMPTSDTEIPHLAFTHHRIGVHPPRPGDSVNKRASGELLALSDLSHLGELDRQRAQGLAYMHAAEDESGIGTVSQLESQSYVVLRDAWHAGLRDAEMAATLALLSGRAGDSAEEYVTYAGGQTEAPVMVRINYLLSAAAWNAQQGRLQDAISAVQQLVKIRRASGDWKLLSVLFDRVGDQVAAQAALRKAEEIER